MRPMRPERQAAFAREALAAPATADDHAYERARSTQSSLVMASADMPLQMTNSLLVLRDTPLRTALSLHRPSGLDVDAATAHDAHAFAGHVRNLLVKFDTPRTGRQPPRCILDVTILEAFMSYDSRDPARVIWPIRPFDEGRAHDYVRRLRRLFPSFRDRL